jgi:decaprenyl-phosphate phosphoribosyltransferase
MPTTLRLQLRDLALLLRLEHWVKNLFVFIPAFFAGHLLQADLLLHATLAFFAFSLVASSVYILNDLVDAPHDRLHPDKHKRPIARGAVKPLQAYGALGVLLGAGLGLAAWLAPAVFVLTGLYFLTNVFYTFWLKHLALIDISLIGVGFLLRIFAGGAATDTTVSQWLIVLTFLLALLLGLAKRRGEYVVETNGQTFRKSLEGYNLPFLDMAIGVCSTVSIVAYVMYCFSPEVTIRIGSDKIYWTAFFVILGVLRYLQLTLVYNKTESPVRALLRDVFLQVVLAGWIGSFIWLLYGKKLLAGWFLVDAAS